jgi:hypothetical protein
MMSPFQLRHVDSSAAIAGASSGRRGNSRRSF